MVDPEETAHNEPSCHFCENIDLFKNYGVQLFM